MIIIKKRKQNNKSNELTKSRKFPRIFLHSACLCILPFQMLHEYNLCDPFLFSSLFTICKFQPIPTISKNMIKITTPSSTISETSRDEGRQGREKEEFQSFGLYYFCEFMILKISWQCIYELLVAYNFVYSRAKKRIKQR